MELTDKQARFFYWGPLLLEYKIPLDKTQEVLTRFNNEKQKEPANAGLASIIKDTKFIVNNVTKHWFIKHVLGDCFNDYCSVLLNNYKLFNEKEQLTSPTYKKIIARKVKLLDLWMNTQLSGEINPPHVHSCDVSFVYYLNVPSSLIQEHKEYIGTSPGPGAITFQYGEPSNGGWARIAHSFIPEVGQLFIFPAQLQHFVQPFYSGGERISVSGNMIFGE